MKNYNGIGLEGCNKIASLDAMTRDELIQSTNSCWRHLYGHDVITNTEVVE